MSYSAFKSLRTPERQHGFEKLRTEGTIPSDLSGTLYRVGAGTFESYGVPHDHWFDGHGVIAGIRFENGNVLGACKLVKPDLGSEKKAQKQLLGRFGRAAPKLSTRLRSTWDSSALANYANTAMLSWGPRLFALYEASHPTEIHPDTLETIGATNLGVARYSFTAHPKFVPSRNTTYAFGFRPLPIPSLDLYALPEGGNAQYLGAVTYNASAFVHDFVATDDYLVFICPPIFASPFATVIQGVSFDQALKYEPEKGCQVIVVPIDDVKKAFKVRIPGRFAVHTANGFQRDGKIIVDAMVSDNAIGMEWVRGATRGTLPENGQDQTIHRFEIDLAKQTVGIHELCKARGEFPAIAPLARCRENQWVYISGFKKGAEDCTDLYSAVHRIETRTAEVSSYECDPGVTTSESVFAPRRAASGELDGYLLTLNYDSNTDQSFCAVLDPKTMTLIGKAWFDHSIPFTFHGLFR